MTATFEAFAQANRQARFSDWLRARAAPAWTQAIGHRFTRELAADTLPDGVYARYLIQDYVFIDTLARLLGHGVARAPELPAMSIFFLVLLSVILRIIVHGGLCANSLA